MTASGGANTVLAPLVAAGFLTRSNRQAIEGFMATWGVSAIDAVLETRILDEQALADALAQICKVDRVFQVGHLTLWPASVATLGYRRARDWQCFVAQHEGTDKPELIVVDPTQSERIALIKQELRQELTLAVGERSDIVGAIDALYPLSAQLPSFFEAPSS
jgi:hypothetical protein